MVNYKLQNLPDAEELPSSDETPVDNELQNLIPTVLRAILIELWSNRLDWFFGINMGVYHATGDNPRIPIVPDGFLSLGVTRLKNAGLRKSYIVWTENNIVPIWVLEVVSETYGAEYDEKMAVYAKLGVLYYVIYNPDFWRRENRDPLEIHKLIDGEYIRLSGEPVWIPEIGLGIGRGLGTFDRTQREWLYWYDEEGNRYPTPEEVAYRERQRAETERQNAETERQRAETERQRAETERQNAETERQRADRLAQLLLQQGIDPDDLSP
ncbi:Uma2 family endonuclease [Oscillatoria sp. HE19RPO]|uniref:Uma2 family endonuclease n=1 Tax=Oscillatoria sp. HE19RPO TaxID=2954806 RepID=UPI0020C273EA|nr:Uma2 family endonuclease [Oscillatoria sp. HE19RPO]